MIDQRLNEQFGIANKVYFYQLAGGITVVSIKNDHATADISLHGAQIISFAPMGQKDILWMSEKSAFEKGKAIRGGIPICFPWFGPHLTDKTKPQHGFARLEQWDVLDILESPDGTIIVSLSLQESPYGISLWPYPFKAVAQFTIGKALDVKFTVTNTGNEPFEYSDALHTYFNISDIKAIKISGLVNCSFYEAFGMDLKTQQEPLLSFETETNRRYINHSGECIIEDPGFKRKICSTKTGSKVTVVWNPWEATSKTMSDVTADGYKTFVCSEPANAYPGIDMIQLAPGASHLLSTNIQII
jgi:glucose-6-phosphate 1-epimerase